jgi:hypothetical protein
MKIIVKCYSGYRADEAPRSIQLGSLVVQVNEIKDRWLSTDHRYFKLIGDDDATYIIRQDVEKQKWELTYYKQAENP